MTSPPSVPVTQPEATRLEATQPKAMQREVMLPEVTQPEANPDARRWATITHIIALVGLLGNGIGFLLGPLVVWLIKRNDHPYVDRQGKEAVNFQITMFIALLLCIPLVFIIVGIGLIGLIVLAMTIFPILAAVRSSEGAEYRYPLSIRFIR
jgi:uncharacterized Tic20 family protein